MQKPLELFQPAIISGPLAAIVVSDWLSGRLPQVAFYKPTAKLNAHPGYTDVLSGDLHIADVIGRIRALGAEPIPMTPVEFGAFINNEINRWLKVAAGVRPN